MLSVILAPNGPYCVDVTSKKSLALLNVLYLCSTSSLKMPRHNSDSASRKKDKHSSRDKLLRDTAKGTDAADEFSKRKHMEKYSTDDSKLSKKKAEVSGNISGQKYSHIGREDNCFASEYDDFEDGKKFFQNSTHVIQQHSRNGLVMPLISTRHSLVDYDDESSDSDSSSESLPPQYPTGKSQNTPRRKSAVQVVSASVKADLDDMRQLSHKSDAAVSRHVRLSSDSVTKQSSSLNNDDINDTKKHRHSPAKLPEPVKIEGKTKDIPVKSPKRRHLKDHHASRNYDDKECEAPSEQSKSRKLQIVDKSEKTTAVSTALDGKDTKKPKKHESETELVSSSVPVHSEKSKTHKKPKKRAFSEQQSLDNVNGNEQKSKSNVSKSSSTDTAVCKKEKPHKVLNESFDHCKTGNKPDRQKKVSSHSDSAREMKHVSHGISSVPQDDLVLKHSSDDHVHSHKKREKEKRGSKKKSHAVDSDSDSDKEKKDRSSVKHDERSAGSKSDKTKDKRKKDKLHHSRTEREFSDEGQISSDSSSGKVKESKQIRPSHTTLKKRSSSPIRASHIASASSKKAVTSEIFQPERSAAVYFTVH